MEWTQFLVVGVIALILGGLIGAFAFPNQVEVEVEKECPECEECEVYEECEDTIVEVPAPSLLDLAVEDFIKAVEDEEVEFNETEINLLRVNGERHEYDFDEISIRKVYDEYTIEYFDDDKYAVTFEIKLKYKESGEVSVKEKYNVEVFYEEDEDTEVTLTELIIPED